MKRTKKVIREKKTDNERQICLVRQGYKLYYLSAFDPPWRLYNDKGNLIAGFNGPKSMEAEAKAWAGRIIDGQFTVEQKEKEEESIETRKISLRELEEMVWAVAEEEFGKGLDFLDQKGTDFHQNFQSFSDKNINCVAIATASGNSLSPTGKLMFGGALFNDGHVEMRWFIGGQCPWFVYKLKAEWPEGYEQYGAFVLAKEAPQCLFVRKEIQHLVRDFSSNAKAPDGYVGIQFSTYGIYELNRLPSWITKKNYLKDWFPRSVCSQGH